MPWMKMHVCILVMAKWKGKWLVGLKVPINQIDTQYILDIRSWNTSFPTNYCNSLWKDMVIFSEMREKYHTVTLENGE